MPCHSTLPSILAKFFCIARGRRHHITSLARAVHLSPGSDHDSLESGGC
jgi:hypothetical protein